MIRTFRILNSILIIIVFTTLSISSTASTIEFRNNVKPGLNILTADIIIPDDFSSIQKGIDNATTYDTIFVRNGLYNEKIVINKTIFLNGESKENCIITDDFSYDSSTITLKKENIELSNFTIKAESNAESISVKSDKCTISNILSLGEIAISSNNNSVINNTINTDSYWAIFIWHGSSNNYIHNNVINTDQSGIFFLANCKNNTVRENKINADDKSITIWANNNIIVDNIMNKGGISLYRDYENVIINNTVNDLPLLFLKNEKDKFFDQEYGQIIVVNCSNISIEKQNFYDVCYGIQIYKSNNCRIQKSSFSNSNPFIIKYEGIIIRSCENIEILKNTFSRIDAINAYESYNITISYNQFGCCRRAIDLNSCNSTWITRNNFLKNSLDIDFRLCSNTKVIENNFLDYIGIYTDFWEEPKADNKWHKNYWGRYRFFPKIITGFTVYESDSPFPVLRRCIKVDWHPARRPYDI